uniref:Sialate O-acetylesterase n=1 Tax=Roseihalotalea indica TaxID=2867963 RepID=A0AA49GN93_9BACT|nr:sialate O-acetylesterase [Tunicatimonas sp. TK19036]
MIRSTCLLLCLGISLSFSVTAQITLPQLFSDHMVLQRDQPIPIWGKAAPKEKIQITFNNKSYTAKADNAGQWKTELPATQAGGPYTINIQSKSGTETLDDVLIGDVFLCGGQSNMEWRVSQLFVADKIALTADDPQLRLIKVKHDQALHPQEDILPTEWKVSNEQNVRNFSAVAYFFAKQLREQYDVPIGLISSNWGGTPVESWMSAEALSTFPSLDETVKNLQAEGNTMNKVRETYHQHVQEFLQQGYDDDPGLQEKWFAANYNSQDWPTLLLPSSFRESPLSRHQGAAWFKKTVEIPSNWEGQDLMLNLGYINDDNEVWINGTKVGETEGKDRYRRYKVPASALQAGQNTLTIRVIDPEGNGGFLSPVDYLYLSPMLHQSDRMSLAGEWHYKVGMGRGALPTPLHHYPATLYNAMIAPLVPAGLKGMIWYQGESNSGRAKEYGNLFPAMIQQWRKDWGSEVPFAFVQIANYLAPVDTPEASNWAELREAQMQALKLPKVGMATIIDIGEAGNIHPQNKQDVGKRLALAMRNIAYDDDVLASGPTFQSARTEGSKMIVSFDNVGSGLMVKDKYGYLKGFILAGSDQKFHWAKAEITGENEITVYSDAVDKPVAVRYAWANNPDQANLYNEDGLPAPPFRSDDWKGITEGNEFSMR